MERNLSIKEAIVLILLCASIFIGCVLLVCFVIKADTRRASARNKARAEAIEKARGPQLFFQGQNVVIKTTGERSIVIKVQGDRYDERWHYWCRVAFGRKDYPIGVITNPTQITKTYELVDFYGFELEAR